MIKGGADGMQICIQPESVIDKNSLSFWCKSSNSYVHLALVLLTTGTLLVLFTILVLMLAKDG